MNALASGRTIVVGGGSHLWRSLASHAGVAAAVSEVIGHAAVEKFAFAPTDRVWVLSYSRRRADNARLLERLRLASVAEVYYVSSSSAIVGQVTRCYGYPRIKADAEREALRNPAGRILTLGLIYADPAHLPGGENIATSIEELAEFFCNPAWPSDAGRRKLLFRKLQRPFRGGLEAALYARYDQLLGACGRFPCLLRPLDLALRLCGYRWYGYVRLSNRLWYSTISS